MYHKIMCICLCIFQRLSKANFFGPSSSPIRSRDDSPAVFEKRLKFRRCSGLVTGVRAPKWSDQPKLDQLYSIYTQLVIYMCYIYYSCLKYTSYIYYEKCWEPFDVKGYSWFTNGRSQPKSPVATFRHNFRHGKEVNTEKIRSKMIY